MYLAGKSDLNVWTSNNENKISVYDEENDINNIQSMFFVASSILEGV